MKKKEVPFAIAIFFTIVSLVGGLITSCVVYLHNMFDPDYNRFRSEEICTEEVLGATLLLTITFGAIAVITGFLENYIEKGVKEVGSENKADESPQG